MSEQRLRARCTRCTMESYRCLLPSLLPWLFRYSRDPFTPRGKGENRCPRCSRSWEQGWGVEPTWRVQRSSPGKGVKGLSCTSAGGALPGVAEMTALLRASCSLSLA